MRKRFKELSAHEVTTNWGSRSRKSACIGRAILKRWKVLLLNTGKKVSI